MDNEQWQNLIQIVMINKGKIIGGIIGFFVGLLILIIGFFKTLLVLIFTIIGFYFGSRWDLDGDLKKILDKLLPHQFR